MENKKISLIIAFYNKIDRLKWVFEALKLQTFKDFEVVVADDGSNRSVVSQLNLLIPQLPFPVKHIWHEDKGWTKNVILNAAVRASSSPLLVFIDGDCIPNKYFLEDHYKVARKGEVSTGRRVMLTEKITSTITEENIKLGMIEDLFFPLLLETISGKKTKMEQMFRFSLSSWIRKVFIKERERFILGCNFSLYKEDLLKVNGFDERFVHPGYGEDIDLGNRLERVGVKLMSRKNMMIIFHTYHKHFFTDFPESLSLLEANKNSEPYTIFGVNQ